MADDDDTARPPLHYASPTTQRRPDPGDPRRLAKWLLLASCLSCPCLTGAALLALQRLLGMSSPAWLTFAVTVVPSLVVVLASLILCVRTLPDADVRDAGFDRAACAAFISFLWLLLMGTAYALS